MVKSRPVVVVSPRLRKRDGLCTVVPLSTNQPNTAMDYHHRFKLARPLPAPFDSEEMWAKCDMLATVSFDRLELFRLKTRPRKYIMPKISQEDLAAIRRCLLHALGME